MRKITAAAITLVAAVFSLIACSSGTEHPTARSVCKKLGGVYAPKDTTIIVPGGSTGVPDPIQPKTWGFCNAREPSGKVRFWRIKEYATHDQAVAQMRCRPVGYCTPLPSLIVGGVQVGSQEPARLSEASKALGVPVQGYPTTQKVTSS